MTSLEETKIEGQKWASLVASYEADFRDLVRRDKVVLAKLTLDFQLDAPAGTFSWAKSAALASETYQEHLAKIKEAENLFVEAERGFRIISDYLKAVTSENYRKNAEIKAAM